jgi:hypothetical protein
VLKLPRKLAVPSEGTAHQLTILQKQVRPLQRRMQLLPLLMATALQLTRLRKRVLPRVLPRVLRLQLLRLLMATALQITRLRKRVLPLQCHLQLLPLLATALQLTCLRKRVLLLGPRL